MFASSIAEVGTASLKSSTPHRGRSRLMGVATALLLTLGPAAAQAQLSAEVPQNDPSADGIPLSAPQPGGFIINGGQKGDWGFIMGPIGSPDMRLKLIKANADKSGAVAFDCSRATGAMHMAIVLPGASFVLLKPVTMKLTVGDTTNKLLMAVETAPPPGKPPNFQAAGLAVPEILKAMGSVPSMRMDARLALDDGAGHIAAFTLTNPRTVASQASEICAAWALKAQNRLLSTAKSLAPDPSAPVHPAPPLASPPAAPPVIGAVHAGQ